MSLIDRLQRFLPGLATGRGRGGQPWPFLRGNYHVVDATAPVVVCAFGSPRLSSDLAALGTDGLCMTYTLNGSPVDMERLARTLMANLSVQYLVLAGNDVAKGTEALQALFHGGPDEVAAALANARLSATEIAGLRKQVRLVHMPDCSELDTIVSRIRDLSTGVQRPDTGFVAPRDDADVGHRVIAADNMTHETVPDKAGDFKIAVVDKCIVVEHYNKKEELLRVVEGTSARSICLTLVGNGWISRLDHAAYLGRELARAELALREGHPFEADSNEAPTPR